MTGKLYRLWGNPSAVCSVLPFRGAGFLPTEPHVGSGTACHMRKCVFIAVLCLGLTGFTVLAMAAPKGGGSTVVATIKRVDTAAGTVTINTGATHKIKYEDGQGPLQTYKVNQNTKVTLNGLPASLSELRRGMKADVIAATDRSVAAAISASDRPGDVDKKEKKEAKKAGKLFAGEFGRDEVFAIDAEKITVARKGGKEVLAYRITRATKIFINDKPGEVSSIRVEMPVTVVRGTDPTVAAAIKAVDSE